MPVITRGLAQNPPAVPEGKGKLRIFDERQTGFLMEIRPSGSVTFYMRYRDPRGRQREIKLGRHGDVTLDQARKQAQHIKAEASLGRDPAAVRDRLRAVLTFSEFIEKHYLPFAKDRLRSYRDHESFYRLRLKELWGRRRMDEIKALHVTELQDRLRREGLTNATVNRYVAFVRRVFNVALRWEVYEGKNPARHVEMRREEHRERYLNEAEIRALFRSLDVELNRTAASLIALLAATGARRGEAMNARWEHIDFDRRLWVVPVSKSGKRRHIHLSEAAVSILRRIPRVEGNPWLFPSENPEKPICCITKPWTRIKERAGLPPDLRIHDLRHTYASLLVSKGRSLYEVGQLLGHSQVTMTARYAHLAPASLREAVNLALPDLS